MPDTGGVFFDRDGVVNHPPPPDRRYVTRPEEFHLMPGIAEAIAHLNRAGIPVGVVTNQKGVALGRYTLADLDRIHAHMAGLLASEGARVDDIRFCPHREEDACDCRKPLPGMILEGAKALGVNPSRSWMIGDQPRDLIAGRAAGCRTLAVGFTPGNPGLADDRVGDTSDLPAWFNEHFPFQNRGEVP